MEQSRVSISAAILFSTGAAILAAAVITQSAAVYVIRAVMVFLGFLEA